MLNILAPYNRQLVHAVNQTYVQELMNRQRARMDEYILYREYYDGVHHTQLTDRIRAFLQVKRDADFTVNYCPLVIHAKSDRLNVSAFSTEDDQQADMLWRWWRKNRMDKTQGVIHRAGMRDGDTYLLVEWDNVAQQPRFYFEPAFAGDGVMAYYSDERRDEMEFASKSWRINYGAGAGKKRRLNLYFPDRIEKYVSNDDIMIGHWMPYGDDADVITRGRLGMAGVNWWTDTRSETGQPLGIPIVHFKYNDNGDCYGTSDLARVVPVQDAVNKAMIDLLGAMDANGFPLLVGTGTTAWVDTVVGPGAVAAVAKDGPGASLKSIPAMSPDGLLAAYNALVMEIGRVSGTPLSYLQVSGRVAAEGTMKQQEIALVSQVKKTQVNFGNAWEDAMMIARRLFNAFHKDRNEPALDEGVIIDTIWDEAETRNDKEQAETIALKIEKIGVSEQQGQIELGYNATKRAAFARAALRKQALMIRQSLPQSNTAAMNGDQPQDRQQTMTQTENQAADDADAA